MEKVVERGLDWAGLCMLSSLGTRIGRHRLGLDRTLGSMAIRVSVTSGTRMGSSGYPAERKGSRRRDQTRQAARRHRSRLMEQSGRESVGGDAGVGEEAALYVSRQRLR